MTKMVQGPSRKQLSEEVADFIRQSIMAGEMRPGQSIRADRIGEILSVSATPVREALHALKVEGFLELTPRRGFAVAPLTGADVRDIFRAHALIAGELAARAASNASIEQVGELEALHFELMAAANRDDADALEKKNHEFHREVYLIAGSPRLRHALGTFTRYVPRRFYGQIKGWPRTTAEDHAAIIGAIASGDSDTARKSMEGHISTAGELLASHFESR